MEILDLIIFKTGREPEDWTNEDILQYRDYLKGRDRERLVFKSEAMKHSRNTQQGYITLSQGE